MNANGTPIQPYEGFACNFLGSGYNCPALKLFGYSTERALNSAIKKKGTLEFNEGRKNGSFHNTLSPNFQIENERKCREGIADDRFLIRRYWQGYFEVNNSFAKA